MEVKPAPVEHTVGAVPVILRHLGTGLEGAAAPGGRHGEGRGAGRRRDRRSRRDRVPAFVDLTGLRQGRYNLPVRIDATSGFSITDIDPAAVRVTIR